MERAGKQPGRLPCGNTGTSPATGTTATDPEQPGGRSRSSSSCCCPSASPSAPVSTLAQQKPRDGGVAALERFRGAVAGRKPLRLLKSHRSGTAGLNTPRNVARDLVCSDDSFFAPPLLCRRSDSSPRRLQRSPWLLRTALLCGLFRRRFDQMRCAASPFL